MGELSATCITVHRHTSTDAPKSSAVVVTYCRVERRRKLQARGQGFWCQAQTTMRFRVSEGNDQLR